MSKSYFRGLVSKPLVLILLTTLSLGACRQEEEIIPSSTGRITTPQPELRQYRGVYILNEGTMGRNIASLDFFDYTRGEYHRNLYPERNPYIARELGDVGNDLKLYRGELWAVINSSNLVEVMQATTAQHLAQLSIPNARYIAFEGDFAYVSSYAGPLGIDPNAREGKVVKIDIRTKQIVAECVVGYQPEEMAVLAGKLYVANSGGYRKPHYDDRLSVIDLERFTLVEHIRIGINLHRVRADRYGRLWISSRGNYTDIPSNLYVYDPKAKAMLSPSRGLGIACSDMFVTDHHIYLYGSERSTVNQKEQIRFAKLDLRTLQVVQPNFLATVSQSVRRPYGIAVHSELGEILIADAGDYTNPGRLHCFTLEGERRWVTMTGVIPSRMVFTPFTLQAPSAVGTDRGAYPLGQNPYASRVLDYRPAPGQFVNKMPLYEAGDTPERMRQKAEQAICPQRKQDQGTLITLGAWGGYVVVGFDHRVENKPGLCDIRVLGNTFEGGSEPGQIFVAQDRNGNGYPDEEEWYRIRGSAEQIRQEPFFALLQAQGADLNLYTDYALHYQRPKQEVQAPEGLLVDYIRWSDNQARNGYIRKNSHHQQPYYPSWLTEERLSFRGIRLPSNVGRLPGTASQAEQYIGYAFGYGYADNAGNHDDASAIDLSWAVDARGQAVHLSGIDFVKVQTAVLSDNAALGETSTEVSGVVDLHLLGQRIPPKTR